MKAPDKIILPAAAGEMQFLIDDTVYIRKDVLLEWAKEKKKQLLGNESANDDPSDVAAGINAGLDMLIGKLNSM